MFSVVPKEACALIERARVDRRAVAMPVMKPLREITIQKPLMEQLLEWQSMKGK